MERGRSAGSDELPLIRDSLARSRNTKTESDERELIPTGIEPERVGVIYGRRIERAVTGVGRYPATFCSESVLLLTVSVIVCIEINLIRWKGINPLPKAPVGLLPGNH